jgi:hypothetical protein
MLLLMNVLCAATVIRDEVGLSLDKADKSVLRTAAKVVLTKEITVRVYLVGYIFCIIDYHICRDIFGRLYILYNRLPYMSGYIW